MMEYIIAGSLVLFGISTVATAWVIIAIARKGARQGEKLEKTRLKKTLPYYHHSDN